MIAWVHIAMIARSHIAMIARATMITRRHVAVIAVIARTTMIVVSSSNASRAAMSVVVAIVATIPSVAHTEVGVASDVTRTVVIAMVLIVAASTVHTPAVSTTIGGVEVGATIVEVVTMGIAGIDAEVPVA